MTATQHHTQRSLWIFPLLMLALAAPAALAEPIGFISAVDGLAGIQRGGESNWEPVALDRNLSIGDTIETERNSFVKALLVDDTTLFIDEDTELMIDILVVGDLATTKRSVLQQMRGQVRARVGNAFGGTTRLEIHTPTAIVGVKGSTMEVRVRGQVGSRETMVKNVSGKTFVLAAGASGSGLQIPRGLCSRILEGRLPEPPMPCPADFESINSGKPSVVTQAALDPFILPGGVAAGGPVVLLHTPLTDPTGPGGSTPLEPIFDGNPIPDGLGGGTGIAELPTFPGTTVIESPPPIPVFPGTTVIESPPPTPIDP